jgi:hypothetical protein
VDRGEKAGQEGKCEYCRILSMKAIGSKLYYQRQFSKQNSQDGEEFTSQGISL